LSSGNLYATAGYRTTEGVDVQPCTDTGGGYNVAHNEAAEWKKYTVNVATTGTYTLSFRVASGVAGGGTFRVENEHGTDISGTMTVPNTGGWQTYQTITKTGVLLIAGRQVLTVYNITNNWNMNLFSASNPATPVQKEAETGTFTGTYSNEGGGDSGNIVILKSADASICFSNVNMAGITGARLHYATGEGTGDTIRLTYPNTSTVLGTWTINGTGGWTTPYLTDGNISFAAQTGTGTVCLTVGTYSSWVASVDYVYLQ